MKMIIQASIFHEIIEEEVADAGRHGVATKGDEVSVLDVSQGLPLRLKLVDISWKLVVQLLDGNGMAILEAAAVNLA